MGFKDQLLRSFSHNPAKQGETWLRECWKRLPFFLLSALFLLFFFPGLTGILALIWLLFAFGARTLEVFFVFQKRFQPLVWAEVGYSTLFLAGVFLSQKSLTMDRLLLFQIGSQGIRFLILWFSSPTIRPDIKFQVFPWQFPQEGVGFFLLAMAGFLEAKTDLFFLKFLDNTEGVGRYSLIFSLLLTLKLLPDFFLGPFVKNLYRSGDHVFRQLKWQFLIMGIFITLPGLWAVQWFTRIFYGQDFSFLFMVGGFAYVLPRYFFAMDIYALFQQKRERWLVWGTLAAMVVNAGIHFWAIPQFGADGAIIGAAAGQWVLLVYFLIRLRENKKALPA